MANPSRDVYKTKAQVVKLIQQAVADGADLIQQQGDAGLDKTTKFPFGNRLVYMDFDKLGQNLMRPAVEALRLEWYGWHGFRRGIASNLYELGANDKVVQRILRHAKPQVTKERYIKALIRQFWLR